MLSIFIPNRSSEPLSDEDIGPLGLFLIVGASLFLIVTSSILLASAYGIYKSRRWGHLVAAVMFGLSLLLNTFAALVVLLMGKMTGWNDVSLLPQLAVTTYCIRRLTGRFGPRPV